MAQAALITQRRLHGATHATTSPTRAIPYHLKWWQIPTSALAGGQYRLQVTTTNVDLTQGGLVPVGFQPSDAVGAANRFSLEVTSAGGQPRVHGLSRMATYANIQAGTESYYLAQIDAPTGANKTVEIQLYDPGDVGRWRLARDPEPGQQHLHPGRVHVHQRVEVERCRRGKGPHRHGHMHRDQPPGYGATGRDSTRLSDRPGQQRQPLRQLLADDPHPAAGHLRRGRARRERLVEDPVHRRRRQRHHDLDGRRHR